MRFDELAHVTTAIESMPSDFHDVEHISFHAPSNIPDGKEAEVVETLMNRVPESWAIVVHPDVIEDFALWKRLDSRLCIENMDQRKKTGRTLPELKEIFKKVPNARFCFDIGHCHQVDPTMTESIRLLVEFRDRLALAHVSEVDYRSHHVPVTYATFSAFQYVSEFLRESCPLVIESVMFSDEDDDGDREIMKRIRNEFEKITRCFAVGTRMAS
ncbi:MAG: TIM barrel protein [Planctomycetota bacterium]